MVPLKKRYTILNLILNYIIDQLRKLVIIVNINIGRDHKGKVRNYKAINLMTDELHYLKIININDDFKVPTPTLTPSPTPTGILNR